jgi:hypothetical protein
MSIASRRLFLQAGVLGAACACAGVALAQTSPAPSSGKFVCPPCGCAADGKVFDAPGTCPECGMTLVPKPAEAPKDAASPPKADPGGGGSTAAR